MLPGRGGRGGAGEQESARVENGWLGASQLCAISTDYRFPTIEPRLAWPSLLLSSAAASEMDTIEEQLSQISLSHVFGGPLVSAGGWAGVGALS